MNKEKLLEWIGDLIGALSLFVMLWAGLWASAIFGS